ncbi:MAG: efflux RND transporter periplasmic adaptor subunit [Bdellovibrionaceae bacterium]|nr:efflux RND transporter periplasmic adaptor subunit [Bdellovibrio sp.]
MKFVKQLITIVQEDIIGTGNRLIAIVWLLCLACFVGMGLYLNSESRSFLGVADSREQQVSFEYPVEIKQIHVISGQTIRKGELLMELDQSQLNEKIRVVKSHLAKLESEKNVRRHLNLMVSNSANADESDPLLVEINDFKQQLENLETQRKNLYVFATVDGVVGSVSFRKGERVPAFTSILTLSPQNPTYVEGFIHESLHTQLEIGKTVNVTPATGSSKTIEGRVVSVGSRLIVIPSRLMHNQGMQIYGREVVIELPSENELLLGEKVEIKPKFNITFLPQASAAADKKAALVKLVLTEPQEMQFPAVLAKRFDFEPSGAVYLEDLKKYLVISDDTDSAKSASLFLVNSDGRVDDQVLSVPGIDKISDLESISQVGSNIYLLTSQGLNKKGKDKKERNLLVRTKRSGITFSDTETVELRPLLLKAIKGSANAELKAILSGQNEKDFEIESHFIRDENLYLGLKNPLSKDNKAIILMIKEFDSLFTKKTLAAEQVSLWKTIEFKGIESTPHRISDIISVDGNLYATTVCNSEQCGAIWKLSEQGSSIVPKLIKFYKEAKPEGLAFNSKEKTLFIAFDQKEKAAKFAYFDLKMALESESSQKSAKAEK